MRIGIFGNTNNNPLLLALGLRRLGHEAVLVVNRKERLHRPESLEPSLAAGYPRWIMDCSDLAADDFVAAHPRIAEVLTFLTAGSGGLVLNDLGPSLLAFCSLPAIALLTGSDLTYYAHPQMPAWRFDGCAPDYFRTAGAQFVLRRWEAFVERQRAGIRAATTVATAIPGLVPEMDDLLAGMGIDESRRDAYYMARIPARPARPRPMPGRLRIVNGARLNWKPLAESYSTLDHKATDILLRGFAAFIADGGEGELVLFRKGQHVGETAALVDALGIAARVVWRDQVSLQEFHAEIAAADVVCDQLGDTFPGMVSLDAMALGLPVIANFRPEISHPLFPKPVAACQARTVDEVAAHLVRLAGSIDERARIGQAARAFARAHFSPEASAARCVRDLMGESNPARRAAGAMQRGSRAAQA